MTRDELARLLCKTEHAAPDPDAPIYIGMRAAQAWEARLPQADKLIAAGIVQMTGFYASLTDEQKAAALAYEGPEGCGPMEWGRKRRLVAELIPILASISPTAPASRIAEHVVLAGWAPILETA